MAVGGVFLLYSCENVRPELPNKGDPAPAKLKVVKVQNIPGGAHIFFTVPKSKSLGWVKAVYTTKANGKQHIKATRYNTSLTVRGFANTKPHKVKLYTVSRGGTPSEPVTVTIHPKTPPFKAVYNSLQVNNTFGGIFVKYSGNVTKAKMSVVFRKKVNGELLPVQTGYISKKKGTLSIHGMEARPYKLAYYVRDRYQNYSDTTFITLTPLFEVELNRHLFSNAKLPTDTWEASAGVFPSIWDQAACRGGGRGCNSYTSVRKDSMPMWITIDLGQKVKVDRIIFMVSLIGLTGLDLLPKNLHYGAVQNQP